MAAAILSCTFVLLLYLQGNCAQQGLSNNQNGGVNNAIGFQQQAMQRTNAPNNMNQTPNGGFNMNLPQQTNYQQQGNLQQPMSGNFQGNLQPSLSVQANLQPQGGSVSLGNIQFTKPGLQLPSGLVISPSKSQSSSAQTNNGCRQNAQTNQQQNNMAATSNACPSQTQTTPYSSNSLAELAALKGQPSLLSLFSSQNNVAQPQQHLQMANYNPSQNQLTDVQKQFLVRAIQSQSSGQNQPVVNFAPTQFRIAGSDNRPAITVQGSPVSSQPPQAIVTPIASQQPYITVQAQPLTNYMQNQQPQVIEEPSIQNYILSELQGSDPQYNMYPPYPVQKKESKSSLKTLIPLIINLLKEKSSCGCQNCGCSSNGCGTNNVPEPTIFGGYSSLMKYGQGAVDATTKTSDVEETKSKSSNNKEKNNNVKKNVVNVDSEEASDENYSDEVEDSEEE